MSMNFEADEDLQAIVEAVRGFASEEIRPQLRELEEARGLTAELAGALVELGVTTLPLPERLGGSDDLDARAEVLCLEELAWGDVGVATAVPGPGSAAVAVLAAGSA
ncbi:MAG: acyl-CoA dehydrogenase family protein, partial [Planctomycetes bacterium]|nr:acyl-CoA dehydrogenase family protein [Planctomycetota bacterium]